MYENVEEANSATSNYLSDDESLSFKEDSDEASHSSSESDSTEALHVSPTKNSNKKKTTRQSKISFSCTYYSRCHSIK